MVKADDLTKKVEEVMRQIDMIEKPIREALPPEIRFEHFVRSVKLAIEGAPGLLECKLKSLLSAIVHCAMIGLEPDTLLREAHLVPAAKGRVDVIIGYRGYIKLARRSKEIETIEARTVYSEDHSSYAYGTKGRNFLEHVPTERLTPGKIRYAYAICRTKTGGEYFEIALPRHVERIKKYSRRAHKANSPWRTHEDQMWRKTAVRMLEPFLPLTAEARAAFAIDEALDRGHTLDLPWIDDAFEKQTQIERLTREITKEE